MIYHLWLPASARLARSPCLGLAALGVWAERWRGVARRWRWVRNGRSETQFETSFEAAFIIIIIARVQVTLARNGCSEVSFGPSCGATVGARVHLELVRDGCSETLLTFGTSFGAAFVARIHLALVRNGCPDTSFEASFGAVFVARVHLALVQNGCRIMPCLRARNVRGTSFWTNSGAPFLELLR